MDKLHYLLSYIKYKLSSRHFRGDGVHSPFVYRLITNVFCKADPYYAYKPIEKLRNELLRSTGEVEITDFGTGSSGPRKISAIAANSVKECKYSQLLFRLVNFMRPKAMLELGTSLGLTTLYLSAVDSRSRCITIEGSPQLFEFANKLFDSQGRKNIESYCGNIDKLLPEVLKTVDSLDFVFFDANHRKEPTLHYFHQCLEKAIDGAVFVFDDIYWSRGMTEAWREIINHPRVRVSVDLFAMGIVFFNSELQKEHYVVRF